MDAVNLIPSRNFKRNKWVQSLGHFGEKGIALISVLIAISILSVLTVDFSYNTKIETEAAMNAYEHMRAEYLARSATEIGQLVIAVQESQGQTLTAMTQGAFQLTDFAPQLVQSFNSFSAIPPNTTTLSIPLDVLSLPDLGVLKTPTNTSMQLEISVEDGKYPLSCSGGLTPSTNDQRSLYLLLTSVFRSEIFNSYFDKPDEQGILVTREKLAQYIIDWMDFNKTQFDPNGNSTGSEESYSQGNFVYKAHDYSIDSLRELQLVHGMNAKFTAILDEITTPYGNGSNCQVSVENLRSPLLLAGILIASSGDPTVATDPNVVYVSQKLSQILRFWPMASADPTIKAMLAKLPVCKARANAQCKPFEEGSRGSAMEPLANLICSDELQVAITQLAQRSTDFSAMFPSIGLTEHPLQGIPLCPGALSTFLTSSGSSGHIYRIKATGSVHFVRKNKDHDMQEVRTPIQARIEGVWDPKERNNFPLCEHPSCSNGKWLYLRQM